MYMEGETPPFVLFVVVHARTIVHGSRTVSNGGCVESVRRSFVRACMHARRALDDRNIIHSSVRSLAREEDGDG